ncbi:uncharacterized protein LOC117109638 [Anneissia japonica]|uniref:uncharacterized protein LOC117109638 n=1 Tax=Anneissia japonica TaxID=1529436 RepID=UPI00142595F4|nr:uncharacterized protein LOC117109638 [Anneissia japonica]
MYLSLMWSLLLASAMADRRRRDYTHLDTLMTVYVLCLHCNNLAGASTFVTDPANRDVYEGTEVFLNCAIRDYRRIKWFVDSTEITSNDRYTVKRGEDTSVDVNLSWLKISKVLLSDAGKQFFCVAVNDGNQRVESKRAVLNVTRVPSTPNPDCLRLDGSYNEGEIVKVTCTQENTNPRVRLNIYKGDKLLSGKPADNIQSTFEYTATFEAHRSDDGVTGLLWCSQTPPNDDYPQRFRKNCSFSIVNVNFAPSITINGATEITLDKQRKEQEVVYVCTSFAKPTSVTYDWEVKFHHDPTVKYYKQHNGSTLRLVLTQSTVVREVNLTCIGHNAVGTSSVTQTLLVNHDSKATVSPTPEVPDGGPEFTWSTALILAVTGSCGLCIALFTAVIIGFYHFQLPQSIDIYGERIAQPEVYFEPKDGISSPQVIDGKHSVGVQVSEQADIESVYTEVSEYGIKKDKDKALPENNSYSHV